MFSRWRSAGRLFHMTGPWTAKLHHHCRFASQLCRRNSLLLTGITAWSQHSYCCYSKTKVIPYGLANSEPYFVLDGKAFKGVVITELVVSGLWVDWLTFCDCISTEALDATQIWQWNVKCAWVKFQIRQVHISSDLVHSITVTWCQ